VEKEQLKTGWEHVSQKRDVVGIGIPQTRLLLKNWLSANPAFYGAREHKMHQPEKHQSRRHCRRPNHERVIIFKEQKRSPRQE